MNKEQRMTDLKGEIQRIAWSNSYFVSTVGGAPISVIKKYIEQQKDF